ncbi:unnamed protein product [Nippostrongylus brasiliensis]|uniref:Rap-GAP domain-containing protein n=1 Tax=Nippostrongylus brasiliensis TaxID=27835 RepID=A0A0N4YNS4_NIPBR|nr:unnamed protein product [Nippostrongylus brasiliensis]
MATTSRNNTVNTRNPSFSDSLTQWLFCWEKSDCVIIGAEDDFLLVFDRINEVHSIMRIRITSEHEVQSAIELMEKRRTEISSAQGTPLVNAESTPLNAHRLQSSGASIAASRIHPASAVAPGGSLIRSVHTRSMTARLARTRSFPHPPHAPPADSPALSIFSPIIQALSRELQRQPDFDLLLAELCLDHVWTEPSKRDICGEIAAKMFISHNVLSQDFVNFFLGNAGQLRSIRAVHTVGNMTTSGTMNTLSCRDAAPIKGGDLTVVLEVDNSVGLYSGHTKCAVAVISRFTITPSMVLHAAGNSSFVIQNENKVTKSLQLTKVLLPPMFTNYLARDLLGVVVDVLPREKAVRLMLDWKTCNRNYESELDLFAMEPQLHCVVRFIFEQIGIVIEKHEKLPWRKCREPIIAALFKSSTSEDCEVDAKQRRPKASAEENWSRLRRYRTTAIHKQDKVNGNAEIPPSNVVVRIYSTAPLHGYVYAVVGAMHASFEEWSLNSGLFHLKSQIAFYLHTASTSQLKRVAVIDTQHSCCRMSIFEWIEISALTVRANAQSVLGMSAYSSYYKSEFLECSNCIYEILRSDGLVLGVGLGTGRLALMTDVHRLLGRNWERRLRLEQFQVDKVAEIIFSANRTPAQKSVALISEFGFTRWTIEQLPPSVGLLLGSIIIGHTSSELFQFKRPQMIS